MAAWRLVAGSVWLPAGVKPRHRMEMKSVAYVGLEGKLLPQILSATLGSF